MNPLGAVLIDRDGVLNEDLPTGVRRAEDMVMIPGSAQGVALLCRAGLAVAVCTNQANVGRGILSVEALAEINQCIDGEVRVAGGSIAAWHICPHRPEAGCGCRKPRPGLLVAALAQLGLDPGRAIYIGDDEKDIEAALAAGCRPWLVRTGKGRAAARRHPQVTCHENLLEAARGIYAEIGA